MRSRETGSGAGKSRASPDVGFFWVTYLWLSASLSVCAPLTVGPRVVWLSPFFGGCFCFNYLHHVVESCM